MLTTTIVLSLVSFLAGLIDSISGGGGLLLVPSLLLAGLPPQTALGTNKFAATIGTATALFNFIRGKKVIWKIAAYGIIFALIGSYIGTKTILAFDNRVVGRIIVFLLPLAILVTLIPRKTLREKERDFSKLDLYLKAPLICFAVGFYDGFFGPGAGSFYVLGLFLFLGANLVHASATSKAFNFISNFGALMTFIFAGKIIYLLGIPLAVANILGNYLGSHLTIRKGDKIVRIFLIISLSILLISLIWHYFIRSP
jgi:uncharacterized membrane protein YfcA